MAFYLLDKPQGITSNKALSFIKREHNISKAGFSGVLDPFATGLLIVATKGDTRFLDLFLRSPKTYTGTILFGKRTDTLDIDGKVISEDISYKVKFEDVQKLINEKFIGKISQVPPKYSNIKVDGKRAHELSRGGNTDFELKSVEREVYSFELEQKNETEITFKVTVSSGTYIRSLARDIGDELNVPTMLSTLRRISVGDIKVVDGEVVSISREEIVPFKFVDLSEQNISTLLNGKVLELKESDEDLIAKDSTRTLWIKKKEDNLYKIHKNIE